MRNFLLILVLFFGASNFSNAALYRISGVMGGGDQCYSDGDVVSSSYIGSCVPKGRGSCARFRDGWIRCDVTNPIAYASNIGSEQCPDGQELNPLTGKCEYPLPPPDDSCSDEKGKDAPFPQGPLPDDGLSMGASRLSCDTGKMCEVLSGYRAANDRIIKDSFYTGEDCVGNSNDYANCPYYGSCDGQSPPEPDDLEEPWNGCKKPYIDQPFVCREDTDGDGRPNPDAPYDDAAICDYDSSGKFSCRLGSFDNDKPTDPIEPTEPDGDVSHGGNIPDAAGDPATIEPVEPPPEVTEPELTPDSNGDIVKAVTSMNSDFNKALNDLNIDINQSQGNINTELDRLNKNVVNNSNATRDLAQTNIDIYNNTKQLIQGVEVAVKTGTATTVEAINTNGENTVNAVNDGFTGMGESLEKIEGSLDALTNVDTGSAGTSGSCIETDTCTGFYTSGYPDGLSGVANAHFESIKTNVLDGFVNTFGSLDLSNAKRPNFSIPILDFGSYSIEDYLNLDWIFGFVRFCLIFTAIATARKNILGG
ncbi:Methyl-accepting chemotaxis protein [Vibrio crassostreae]|uniref:hypothetical protein n=1 Tax=Vibrio crassostreae TaxID=246167 RepID=UPI001BD470B9|nr:hypothetical protein [Vibrio crassostreae]CAK2011931.1 Methyl-accepting chemotaxis protein [Vibrio crassostreae]CAK2040721.1 Methyl-accepting chemotaxis protein [Vibrio crassostreae]CAK2299469.1 Methyl-accepting chemotaxis protein [Vibrio crassostreae]CAK2345530.1 Methyl-accepting chemotaxis protein [Vibrio crassostreae]CAK2350318.1 Methyl-accepting chemotaxis protein [Vibrio crassostreae]